MKKKIDWKNGSGWGGGVELKLTEEQRETLNKFLPEANKGHYPVMATKASSGNIYISTIHGQFSYNVDTVNAILYLADIFDFKEDKDV
jgi:hypothetical protein